MLIYFIFDVILAIIEIILKIVVSILLLIVFFYSCFYLLFSSVLYSWILIKYFPCFYHFILCYGNSVTHPLYIWEEHFGPRERVFIGDVHDLVKGGRFGGETTGGRCKQLLETLFRLPIYSLVFVHRFYTLISRKINCLMPDVKCGNS